MTASALASAETVVAGNRNAEVRVPLPRDWEMSSSADSRSIPARIPGTVASALREHGLWRPGSGIDFDAADYSFRCRFDAEPTAASEEVFLEFGGIATLGEVWLNGRHILTSSSMFELHRVDVSELLGHDNQLLIVCRSLLTALQERRTRQPRPRWRTRVVSEQQLRWFRTTLLGRAPGFAPEPAPVGPWRPVTLVRHRHIALEHWSREARMDGDAGIVTSEIRFRALRHDVRPVAGWLQSGEYRAPLDLNADRAAATLRIPDARAWWPHTHGEPALYPMQLELKLSDGSVAHFDDVPVGFRSIEFTTAAIEKAGFRINGIPLFCRGIVWTPADPVAFGSDEASIRRRLSLLRDAGFNLIRLAGTTVYEDETFHRICDEFGLLVWQDMMFANMDYPFADPEFLAVARREAECELSRVSRHASTAMICGNSEIEQQVAMLGFLPQLGRDPFFAEELPRIAAQRCPGVPYVPSAPSGGDQPFRTRTGIANYFGVGAYLRPLDDARRAAPNFASECLAFSNVPESEMVDKMSLAVPGGISPSHPAWKRGIPRDAGAGWDFEDVRDHYLKLLYAVDPVALRQTDTRRYLDLSRMVSGEVMAEVLGEWRRPGSHCGGGIILWSADPEPGAGWGILDSDGNPKPAYWFLKRALGPCAIWTTDEGLNGIDIHVANDTPGDFTGWLRIALFSHGEKTEESGQEISIAGRSSATFGFEEILGRFVDASYAYRFGPPALDLLIASLHATRDGEAIAQTFRFPSGRNAGKTTMSELGLSAQARAMADGSVEIRLQTGLFANGVRVSAPDMAPDDNWFAIEPGGIRRILMMPMAPGELPATVSVTAINAECRLAIPVEGHPA